MGGKRKREPLPNKPRKQKLRAPKPIRPLANVYGSLAVSSESDNELVFDYEDRQGTPDIVLVDSEDEVVVVSDEEPATKKQKGEEFVSNELAKNEDFIGFGFDSSSGEEDEETILSSDERTDSKSNSLFPWVKDHDHSKQQEIADWLTMEMKDFVNYISPSSEEIVTRNKIINRLKSEIQAYWPYAEAHVFGSCATDLYLPGSDIDMVLVSKTGELEHRSKLYQLSSFLRTHKLARNIEVIAKAKVPIIKFVDPDSGIPVDVSFEKTNGLDAAKKIRRWLTETPGLREMVLIVKQFLRSRKLNNVHVGGLGGYSTIILCYHFLTLHPKVSTESMSVLDNLGALLIEFFELYGRNFAYDNLIISLEPRTDMPRYLLKRNNRWLDTSNNSFSIVIQDPSDPNNNISRASHNLRDIKKAFGGAYQLLTEKCYALNSAPYKERLGQLILGDIIKYKGKERDFNDDRSKITNDALIAHGDRNSHPQYEDDYYNDESDGAEGNDKYYISDMTLEDDELKPIEVKQVKVKSSKKVIEVKDKDPVKINKEVVAETKEESETKKKAIVEYLGLSEDENEQEEDSVNLDKESRRDYWRQKGLEL